MELGILVGIGGTVAMGLVSSGLFYRQRTRSMAIWGIASTLGWAGTAWLAYTLVN